MKRIPCHWTNRAGIGEPRRFEVTGYREAEPKEHRAEVRSAAARATLGADGHRLTRGLQGELL